MSLIIGIDVGGSTTKIVGVKKDGTGHVIITPQHVRANDPVTATYGAFGKFTDDNNLSISDITRVMMTGVGSSYIKKDLYGLESHRLEEFTGIGRGGLYLSGLDEALVVSMGTGTALVHATRDGKMKYVGGTGVGGGTLLGLSRLLLNLEDIDHLAEFAKDGEIGNIDLRIKDITAPDMLGALHRDLTASNFGGVSDVATKSDVALGIMNMVFEAVAMVSVFAARAAGVKSIVLTGNVTRLGFCKEKFEQLNDMGYGVRFIIPEHSQYATVIGTALAGFDREYGGSDK
ncbi:MAG: pantothenate kinase [Clostridia bacterium]|nr:pantothenate kinase [Clostridia bacterium]